MINIKSSLVNQCHKKHYQKLMIKFQAFGVSHMYLKEINQTNIFWNQLNKYQLKQNKEIINKNYMINQKN